VSWPAPNLARSPCLNRRPLHRVAGALAVLALALTGWNVATYTRAGSGAAAKSDEIARLRQKVAAARERLATIESDLASRDLAAENRRAAFLNDRIEERAFSWNELFDRLAEALPRGVRLRTLSPRVLGSRSGRRGGTASLRTPVRLNIAGEAEDDEALLELVDNLFAHDSFAAPDLQSERRTPSEALSFKLDVVYYPRGAKR